MGNGKIQNGLTFKQGQQAVDVERLARIEKIDLVLYNGAVVEALQFERKLVVSTDDVEKQAIDYLSVMKKSAKNVEDERKRIIEPFREFIKRVDNLFRPISDGLGEVEGLIKRKVLAYQSEKERRRQEEQRKAEEEYRKKLAQEEKKAAKKGVEAKYVPPPVAPEPEAATKFGSIGSATTKEPWTFVVEDVQKVPRQYLEFSPVLVRAAIRAGARQIPGLRIYQDKQLSVK